MRWLIRLYPKKWREKYEEEFIYILENRKLSFAEIVDIVVNAIDARNMILSEGMMHMNGKLRDFMLQSAFNRMLILGPILLFSLIGGYTLSSITPLLSELSTPIILIIGVSLGLIIGFARGIIRVIKVTQKEKVSLPTGKLTFSKSEN
jgi:hypothetical protein